VTEVMVPTDDEAVRILTEMVSIPSVSGDEGRLAGYLVETMRALGFRACVDQAGNAVGELGGGPRHIALVGHMDTVPGAIPVRREGNVLYGRGAVDAKGSLAAFVVAAARVGELVGLRITVAGAVEEEAATSKGARYIAETYCPDYCVIGEPSGWHRVTIGYKGRLLIDYSSSRPMSHTAGEAGGVCEEAIAFWLRICGWAESHNRGREGRFSTLDPSLRSIQSDSDGLTERVEMTIGLRLPPGLDVDAFLEDMVAWAGGATVTTRGREAPFRADKRTPLISAFLSAIRAEGGRPAFLTKTGTSDMNVLGPAWRCPIVAYGPGDSAYDHTPDEQIDLDEYLLSIRVLTRVLQRLSETDRRPHAAD